jgi:hypothetical protein
MTMIRHIVASYVFLTGCASFGQDVLHSVLEGQPDPQIGRQYEFRGLVSLTGEFRLYLRTPSAARDPNGPCLSGVYGAPSLYQQFRQLGIWAPVRIRGILAGYEDGLIVGGGTYLERTGYPTSFENHCNNRYVIVALSVIAEN